MEGNERTGANPLGTLPVQKLLLKFTVPSIIAMLTSALYNMVDQYFIGNSVGELGNAATNIAFPLTTSCIAVALLFGIGGAAAFNLAKGQGDEESAVHYMGNSITGMLFLGILLTLVTQLFLRPLLVFFGTPGDVMEYAATYVRITSIGFPMLIFSNGGGHLIRADGSPQFSMLCNITGAVINTILDAWFVFGLHWGMAGAAWATIIGQYAAGIMAMVYLAHARTVTLRRRHMILQRRYVGRVMSLGAAPCSNQIAMMVVQIVLNKSLTYYGARSSYGEAIPLACAGIISKVNQVYFSFIIGLSQGLQPIVSFNYGAEKYRRVKQACLRTALIGLLISITAFGMFQLLPRQIIALFGDGSEEYFRFAISYFRIYLLFTFLNFVQPVTSNIFTAIGRPGMGMFLSLTRQILFLLPLIVVLPLFLGIDGILYAGPIADGVAGIVSVIMIVRELGQEKYRSSVN
ncbi:MAG: MATE family efflux transporter [Lachnospiraceae bacterium]|nr:MATE family efflux transporter [Lachnospiraceae bacterium]